MSTYLTGTTNFWVILAVIFARYVVLASIGFLLFYVILRRRVIYSKIQQRWPRQKDYFREIGYSIITAVIFALIGFAVFTDPLVKYTQVYYKISDYGTGYFLFSIVLMLVVHDAYFYWAHRAMHHSSVYRWVHQVHHQSTNPSPWAAMAFHPIESFIEGAVIAVMAVLFPVHPLSIGIWLLLMMIYNVNGHLGYELYPKGFSRSTIGRWLNTSVSHNQHHQYFKGNYGLYFLWWDRWMGTLRKDYDDQFEEVKNRKRQVESALRVDGSPLPD